MLKKIALALILLFLLAGLTGGGYVSYQYYKIKNLSRELKEQTKLREAAAEEPATVVSGESDLVERPKVTIAKTVRTWQETPCTPVYQKYIENRKITEMAMMLDSIDGVADDDPCLMQVLSVLDIERMTALMLRCSAEALFTEDSKQACLAVMTLGWASFAETEYANVDPSEIPADALHSKINFRLIEKAEFLKNASNKDKQYLFELLEEMNKSRPDIDYGTTRDELISEFHKKEPATWKETFEKLVEDLEQKGVQRAIITFYEGNGGSLDNAFLEYVSAVTARHPQSQMARLYKALAHGGLGDWPAADAEILQAEKLQAEVSADTLKRVRKSVQDRQVYFFTYSWASVRIELPTPKP